MRKKKTTENPVPTPSQRDILQLIAAGIPSKQIAGKLEISLNTVNGTRYVMMQRYKVSSAAQLVAVLNKYIRE